MRLYWGDLHSHCAISYGHGTVEQALQRARAQLDFCSVTGHAFWPDMPTNRKRYGDIIDYHNRGFRTLADNWQHLIDLQAAATGDDFIAFPSYEWHSMEYGDHNVYSRAAELPLTDANDLPKLRDQLTQGQLAIPHHIGYPSGYRGINWAEYRPDKSPFVEVFSLHGCSLSDDSPYPMLHDMGPRDFASTAAAGWQLGHRFGIVGGTDHHGAYPGSHGDGRMGVFATALTRESLWDAFLARRVFAATGDKIDARLFVNDAWIGELIQAPSKRLLKLQVHASDAIDAIELIKNDRVLRRFNPAPGPPVQSQRYRVRITWGWGKNTEPAEWNGKLAVSEGVITGVETCFSGQAIVAPQQPGDHSSPDDRDLPHQLLERDQTSCAFRSITQGNKTMRHASTQAISLEIEAPLTARVQVDVNDHRLEHSLEELVAGARSHFMRGWLSEAIQIGRAVPARQCSFQGELEDLPERDVDLYRLQVAQKNGQWVWLTPIWVER